MKIMDFLIHNGIFTFRSIKKFLEISHPRSIAARYYANFLSLRGTGISKCKIQYGNPTANSEEFF